MVSDRGEDAALCTVNEYSGLIVERTILGYKFMAKVISSNATVSAEEKKPTKYLPLSNKRLVLMVLNTVTTGTAIKKGYLLMVLAMCG